MTLHKSDFIKLGSRLIAIEQIKYIKLADNTIDVFTHSGQCVSLGTNYAVAIATNTILKKKVNRKKFLYVDKYLIANSAIQYITDETYGYKIYLGDTVLSVTKGFNTKQVKKLWGK